MQDDIFAWNFKVFNSSSGYFWFDIDEEGRLGYYVSTQPEDFYIWDEKEIRQQMHKWVKYSPRVETYGPYLSDIPPLILKIRTMEQRHKRFLERKINHV